MRGGFVACLTPSGRRASRLEAVASSLKWHGGELSFHRLCDLEVACFADGLHGPAVEIRNGRLLLCHGAPPEPLELLEGHDRFAGLEFDGSSLRAIRDPMGEVPLFYRRNGDEFWLATEIHPLLEAGPAEPDLEWVTAFIARVEYPETTGWVGVRRALPGEILEIDAELRVSSRPYFRPDSARRGPRRPPEEAALRVRELFSAAVSKRATDRCGILLSGGLDSSAVALVASRTTRPTLLYISPGLPDVDESAYAHATADAAGLPLTTLELGLDPWDPAEEIRIFGVPPLGVPVGMYGPGLRALADAGCVTALDGHDGDGTLGNNYAWEANTLLDGRFDRLFAEARGSGVRRVVRETIKGFAPPSLPSRLIGRSSSPGYLASFLPYFRGRTAQRLAAESRWRPPRAGWAQLQLQALQPPTTQFFEEFELLGARAGIDVQHPFADRALIDFELELPHAVKASSPRLKPLLRAALADLLPEALAERDDKTPFTAVLDARVDFEVCYRWIRDSGVRLPDVDYGRLFRDAARPVNDRIFWTRLASAHVFLAGV